jgi:undecaprenyl-diphosphatase
MVGFLVCAITAYLSVRFLVRYFETKKLTPFAIYSLVVGAASILRFGIG